MLVLLIHRQKSYKIPTYGKCSLSEINYGLSLSLTAREFKINNASSPDINKMNIMTFVSFGCNWCPTSSDLCTN